MTLPLSLIVIPVLGVLTAIVIYHALNREQEEPYSTSSNSTGGSISYAHWRPDNNHEDKPRPLPDKKESDDDKDDGYDEDFTDDGGSVRSVVVGSNSPTARRRKPQKSPTSKSVMSYRPPANPQPSINAYHVTCPPPNLKSDNPLQPPHPSDSIRGPADPGNSVLPYPNSLETNKEMDNISLNQSLPPQYNYNYPHHHFPHTPHPNPYVHPHQYNYQHHPTCPCASRFQPPCYFSNNNNNINEGNNDNNTYRGSKKHHHNHHHRHRRHSKHGSISSGSNGSSSFSSCSCTSYGSGSYCSSCMSMGVVNESSKGSGSPSERSGSVSSSSSDLYPSTLSCDSFGDETDASSTTISSRSTTSTSSSGGTRPKTHSTASSSRHRRRRHGNSNSNDNGNRNNNTTNTPHACFVCMKSVSEVPMVVLKPCGHSFVCKDCVEKMLNVSNQCRVCNKPIKSYNRKI